MNPKKRIASSVQKQMTTTAKKKNLSPYQKDFYKWTKKQASFLKSGELDKLDIANLAEEIESLGRSERRTLRSFLVVLLMHMLKVKYQPGKHTKSWNLSIENARLELKEVLKENPSLKPELETIIKEAYARARLEASIETGLDKKSFPKACPWQAKEIL